MMALNDMPAELLLTILSYLDNLGPVSHASRTLSLSARDLKARNLRTCLANIRHIELLMKIWTPPSFFRPREGSPVYSNENHIIRPEHLHDMLYDQNMVDKIQEYLNNLEEKALTAYEIAKILVPMMPDTFQEFNTHEEKLSYATTIVIELWSAQPRYGHDIDGRWSNINDECRLQEVHVRDNYVTGLSPDKQAAMIRAYNTLAQQLQPPFYTSSRRDDRGRIIEGEGMWLYRLIVKEGMEAVLAQLQRLQQRN